MSVQVVCMALRKCTKCGEEKSLELFYTKQKRGKPYLMPECKQCEMERSRRYRLTNKDKVRETKRVWQENNRNKTQQYEKKYRENNKEKRRTLSRNRKYRRRQIEKGSGNTVIIDKFALLSRQGGMCANCKIKGVDVVWHLDHIMPLSRGGTHTLSNVQVLCSFCNQRKSSKLPDQWANENGRLL